MTKFSDVPAAGITIRESADDGSDFTNPIADYRRLFLGEDGLLHVKGPTGTVTSPYTGGIADQGLATFLDFDGAAAPADPTGDHARIYAKTDGRIYSRDAGGTEYGPFDAAAVGGTRSAWELDEPPASPHADDDEFDDSASISDWTAVGRAADTAEIDHASYPSTLHMYLANNTGGAQLCILAKAVPTSYPFYIYTSVVETTTTSDYCRAGGIVLLNAAADHAYYVGIVHNGVRQLQGVDYSGLSGYSGATPDLHVGQMPLRFRIKVNSATSLDIQYPLSPGGLFAAAAWTTVSAANNPGFDIAKAGPGMSTEGNASLHCAWDYYRVVV